MEQTVFIVEDSEGAATPLEIALQVMIGIRVQLFSSARDALNTLRNTPDHVAALVTDLHLPSMDGFELIEVVRARLGSLPIVVISGDSDPRIPAHVVGLGANAYFAKPYSPAAVVTKIEELIGAAAE